MSPEDRDKYLLKYIEESIKQWERDSKTTISDSQRRMYLDYGPNKVCRRDKNSFFATGANELQVEPAPEELSRRSKRKSSSSKEEETSDVSLEISSDDQKLSPPPKKKYRAPPKKPTETSSLGEEDQPSSLSSSLMISGDIIKNLQAQNEELKAKLKAKKEKIVGLKKKNKALKESLHIVEVKNAFLKGQRSEKLNGDVEK